jgi:hypothetical protein
MDSCRRGYGTLMNRVCRLSATSQAASEAGSTPERLVHAVPVGKPIVQRHSEPAAIARQCTVAGRRTLHYNVMQINTYIDGYHDGYTIYIYILCVTCGT